jgi:hypothetical protein
MGIRIHKQLGYALTDLEYDLDQWEATDERLNLEWFNDNETRWDQTEEFVEWVLSNPDEVEALLKDEMGVEEVYVNLLIMGIEDHVEQHGIRTPLFHSPLTHAAEFGEENVLLFQPVTVSGWTRYDDSIDYYDHVARDAMESELVDLYNDVYRNGIYPYEGPMLRYPDRETPEHLLKPIEECEDTGNFGIRQGRLRSRTYNVMIGHGEGYECPFEEGAELLEHLRNDWGFNIPMEIQLFAHWSGVFEDFNTVYRLRPVLYTYWG